MNELRVDSRAALAATIVDIEDEELAAGEPGVTRADLLVINKTGLAPWSAPTWLSWTATPVPSAATDRCT